MTMNPLEWLSPPIWDALDKFGTLLGDIMLVLTLTGAVWGYCRPEKIRRWFTRNRFSNVGQPLREGRYWDAIVFTVSHADVPIWVLDRHNPRHVGLIASTAPESQSAAEAIRQHADRNGMQTHELQILEDPDDPNEAKIKTKALIEQLRHYGLNSIAVDVTGGKVPMSLGAFMGAEESGVSTLYVTAPYNAELKKPDLKKADIRCISKPE